MKPKKIAALTVAAFCLALMHMAGNTASGSWVNKILNWATSYDSLYLDNPNAHYKPGNVIRSLSGETGVKLYLSQAAVSDLVKSKEIEMRRGTAEEAEHLIGLFDKYRPEKAVLVAPHLHD